MLCRRLPCRLIQLGHDPQDVVLVLHPGCVALLDLDTCPFCRHSPGEGSSLWLAVLDALVVLQRRSTRHGLAAICQLMRIGALADSALIVIETGSNETLDETLLSTAGLQPVTARRYGRALLHFLEFHHA